MDRICAEACRELFETYHVALDLVDTEKQASSQVFAATIGYTSPTIKGALTITLGVELVKKSLPHQIRPKDMSHIC